MGQYLCPQERSRANEHKVEAQPVRPEMADADAAHSQFQLYADFDTSDDRAPQDNASNAMPRTGALATAEATAEVHRPKRGGQTAQGSTAHLAPGDKGTKHAKGRPATVLDANRTTLKQQGSGTAYGHSGEPQAADESASSAKHTHGAPEAERSQRDTAAESIAVEVHQRGSSNETQGILVIHGSTARRPQRRSSRFRTALRRTWCCSCSAFCVMLAFAAAVASWAFMDVEQEAHLSQAPDQPRITPNASRPPLQTVRNEPIVDEPFDALKEIGRLRHRLSG